MTATDPRLSDDFRTALRGLASSVTIFTTRVQGTNYGMVATAVMSVSLDPASLVISVNKSASLHCPLIKSGAFCVNLLSQDDAQVTKAFVKHKGQERFAHGSWLLQRLPTGEELPFLASAQAAVFCKTTDIYRTHGTHTLLVGNVVHVKRADFYSPMMYCDGRYGGFRELSDAF